MCGRAFQLYIEATEPSEWNQPQLGSEDNECSLYKQHGGWELTQGSLSYT